MKGAKLLFFLFIGAFIIGVLNYLLAFGLASITSLEQMIHSPQKVSFDIPRISEFIHFQWQYKIFYSITALLFLILLAKIWWNMKMNYQSLAHGQHGTSQFETISALKKQYKIIPAKEISYQGKGGVIVAGLSEYFQPYRILIDEGPINTMVIGITRSGKGETFVFPMLDVLSRAEQQPTLVINDAKGELVSASYETLQARGYEVHIFNLIQQQMGMGFNPLTIVVEAWLNKDVSRAQQYANSVAYSLYHDTSATGAFWNSLAQFLVTAIILALTEDAVQKGTEEGVTMHAVATFLATKGGSTDEETGVNELDLFFQMREKDNIATKMYATSKFSTGGTRSSIFTTAMNKLQIFTLEPNARLTSYNSLSLLDLGFGEKPIALFMITPDFDAANHVLASILVNQIYRVNAERAAISLGGKMKNHIHLLLDEFGNMPMVEGMASMITAGAGRGFRFHLIVQSYAQIKKIYANDTATIIGNCSNQMYVLTKDKETAEQFSALLGKATITDISRSGKVLADKNRNESAKSRALLMPDELMRLKEGESVVVRANKRQDNKHKKIIPKPIYNKGKTAHKFRWEYLQQDFDNAKSLMQLNILSDAYFAVELNVQLRQKQVNEHTPIGEVLTVMEVANLQKILRLSLLANDASLTKVMQELAEWSLFQFYSYLCWAQLMSINSYKLIQIIAPYITEKTLRDWKERLSTLAVDEESEALITKQQIRNKILKEGTE